MSPGYRKRKSPLPSKTPPSPEANAREVFRVLKQQEFAIRLSLKTASGKRRLFLYEELRAVEASKAEALKIIGNLSTLAPVHDEGEAAPRA